MMQRPLSLRFDNGLVFTGRSYTAPVKRYGLHAPQSAVAGDQGLLKGRFGGFGSAVTTAVAGARAAAGAGG